MKRKDIKPNEKVIISSGIELQLIRAFSRDKPCRNCYFYNIEKQHCTASEEQPKLEVELLCLIEGRDYIYIEKPKFEDDLISEKDLKEAIYLFADKYDRGSAIRKLDCPFPELVKIIIVLLFENNFNPNLEDGESYKAYCMIHRYQAELSLKGFVKFKKDIE